MSAILVRPCMKPASVFDDKFVIYLNTDKANVFTNGNAFARANNTF